VVSFKSGRHLEKKFDSAVFSLIITLQKKVSDIPAGDGKIDDRFYSVLPCAANMADLT
jgi:hypothetical protein